MGNIRYDIRQWYFSELSMHLQEHGFATEQIDAEPALSVIWQDQPLCRVNTKGIVFFDSEKIRETGAKVARDRVVDLAKMTNEYIRLMEWAPDLNAEGLDGDYRLLSEFNGTVLAGHPTEYGIEFITWDRTYDHKGVTQGNYFSEGNIEDATVTISEYMEFEQELAGMKQPLHLGQLNALAKRLSQLSLLESTIFEGLCRMEAAKGQGGMELCRAIDLAYSTECCHVAPSALNDSQLGRFYAENGFLPELDKLSDEMFELLDFEDIGIKMRKGEGGVFTTHGYVVQHTELNQVAERMDFTVQPPDYIFRIGIVDCMRDDSGPRKVEYLELPATEEQLNEFPGKLGLEDWMGTAMFSFDGPLPDFDRLIISTDELPKLNDLAKRIQTLTARGDLPKYKAVLSAESCQDLDKALSLADALDAYYYMPSLRTVEEAGREELRFLMDHDAAELAMQHMNLATYGKAVMERHHAVLTDYGTVERKDGQPIQHQKPEPPEFQMSM